MDYQILRADINDAEEILKIQKYYLAIFLFKTETFL